jgi:superfamily II DNA or RNA helicase
VQKQNLGLPRPMHIKQEPYWPSSGLTPRKWQVDATTKALEHLRKFPDVPAIIRAVMGSGKSVAIGSLIASIELDADEVIVVTVPTQLLVRQLHREITQWLVPLKRRAGRYFARDKSWNVPVVICCMDSLAGLVDKLKSRNRKVALWIADEVHRTESSTILDIHHLFAPKTAIGFTATAFRASKGESLSLWKRLLYNYTPSQALRDKVVVPYRVMQYEGSGSVMRDQACLELIKSAKGPGLVNADGIKDAEAFAIYLSQNGVAAKAVHCNMGLTELRERLKELARGELSALVHVSLLAEGVNIPWLRWLCMRRCVASRVRFCQEVGRVLRSSPGKTEAVIYDPHDLFGLFKLDYAAVLGGETEEPDAAPVDPFLPPLSADLPDDGLIRAKALIDSYLRQLSLAFDAAELVQRFVGGQWRDLSATPKQVSFMQSLTPAIQKPHIPEMHRPTLELATAARSSLTRGTASDLISVMLGLKRHDVWPDVMVPDPIPVERINELKIGA